MCHSRLPTPRTARILYAITRLPAPCTPGSFNASMCGNGGQVSGNGWQVDRREKSYAFGMLDGKDFSLAQTGFFSPWHCPASVAPLAQTGMMGTDINAKAVAPGRAGRAGFLCGTGYYSRVAPLAQTGFFSPGHGPTSVAPGRAGRALRSK